MNDEIKETIKLMESLCFYFDGLEGPYSDMKRHLVDSIRELKKYMKEEING